MRSWPTGCTRRLPTDRRLLAHARRWSSASHSTISRACCRSSRGWQQSRLAVPLILSRHEFERTLDVFPLEYGSIIANHLVIFGDAPLCRRTSRTTPIGVAAASNRRRATSIHLREGFLETGGEPRVVARLISVVSPGLSHAPHQPGGTRRRRRARSRRRYGRPRLDSRNATWRARAARPRGPGDEQRDEHVADPSALLARYIDASERSGATSTDGAHEAPSLSSLFAACLCVVAAWPTAQPPPPALTGAGQRLRERHRPGERARDRSSDPALQQRQRRRRRGRHRADVSALRRHQRIRRQDVRERGKGIGEQGQGQRPAGRRRRRRPQGRDRGRLRPREFITDGFSGRDDPRSDPAAVPRRAVRRGAASPASTRHHRPHCRGPQRARCRMCRATPPTAGRATGGFPVGR